MKRRMFLIIAGVVLLVLAVVGLAFGIVRSPYTNSAWYVNGNIAHGFRSASRWREMAC
jgi:hypothetical protein